MFGQNEINRGMDDFTMRVRRKLLLHGFEQIRTSQIAAVLCATIILIGMLGSGFDGLLIKWYVFFLLVIGARLAMLEAFKRRDIHHANLQIWEGIFIFGAFLGGSAWGAMSHWLFPLASLPQETLSILVIAGVTAGAAPALASLYTASIVFMLTSLTPLIVQIFLTGKISTLFDIALTTYLIYMIVISVKIHHMIENIIRLQFKNETLVEELSKRNYELAQLATHDPLTQMENPYLFNIDFHKAIDRAENDNSNFALLYMDLDNFKTVNDIHGHHVGDALLKRVAERMALVIRPSDVLARLGGDEFVILVEGISSRDKPTMIAKNLLNEFTKPFRIEGKELVITPSIGISIFPTDGKTKDELLKAADSAMYIAKKKGRNHYCFYEDYQ